MQFTTSLGSGVRAPAGHGPALQFQIDDIWLTWRGATQVSNLEQFPSGCIVDTVGHSTFRHDQAIRVTKGSGVRTAAILVAVIAILYVARGILIPLAFAIVLALVLSPAVAWLQKLRLGRLPSVLLVMAVSIAIAGGIGWVIFNELVEVVNDLPSYQQNIHNKIVAIRTPGKGAVGRAAASVKELGQELSSAPAPIAPPAPIRGRRKAAERIWRDLFRWRSWQNRRTSSTMSGELATPVLAPLGILGMVLIFTVFLLTEQNDLRNRLFRLAGLDQLNVMTQALDDATRRVSRYLMMQLLVNASFGVLCGIGLYLIGVPYAVLWGACRGNSAHRPLRRIAGGGLIALAALTRGLRPLDASAAGIPVVRHAGVVTGNFVEPWLYGMHTGISSLALLLTTVFWAALWGPAGLILRDASDGMRRGFGPPRSAAFFLHILLGDQPVLAAEAQVYQRLLAMDDHEARAVADVYLARIP